MQAVGIRQLKQQTSEILRLVPVAHPDPSDTRDTAAIWASIDELAAKIGARWPEGLSAADAISEDRREL